MKFSSVYSEHNTDYCPEFAFKWSQEKMFLHFLAYRLTDGQDRWLKTITYVVIKA